MIETKDDAQAFIADPTERMKSKDPVTSEELLLIEVAIEECDSDLVLYAMCNKILQGPSPERLYAIIVAAKSRGCKIGPSDYRKASVGVWMDVLKDLHCQALKASPKALRQTREASQPLRCNAADSITRTIAEIEER